jgi:hypothetical protein
MTEKKHDIKIRYDTDADSQEWQGILGSKEHPSKASSKELEAKVREILDKNKSSAS